MQYMLLIYGREADMGSMTKSDGDQMMKEYFEFTNAVRTSGHMKHGAPLKPTSTATSVRLREGKKLVTDGPFAETREQLGGYYLVDAKDLDEAVAIAARIPGAKTGTIEVRPVMELAGM